MGALRAEGMRAGTPWVRKYGNPSVPGAHQGEPLSPIPGLGVNPFPSRSIIRTPPRGSFTRPQFEEPIKTEL